MSHFWGTNIKWDYFVCVVEKSIIFILHLYVKGEDYLLALTSGNLIKYNFQFFFITQ
jgi:hypothetical protein